MKTSEIVLSYKALVKIFEQDLPFRVALKAVCQEEKVEPITKQICASLLGAELRHHLLFEYLINKEFLNITRDEMFLISLLLANQCFAKKIDLDTAKKIVVNELIKLNSEINKKELSEFLDKNTDIKSLIPEDINQTSFEYYTYRYNTPMWLIKMWKKHFGDFFLRKILLANTKLPRLIASVNPFVSSKEEILSNSDFVETCEDGALEYKKNTSLSLTKEAIEKKIYPSNLAIKYLLNRLVIDDFDKVCLYQGESGRNTYLELINKKGENLELYLLFKSPKDYASFIKNNYDLELTKTQAEYIKGNFDVHVSSKVNLFMVYAESSSFANIRTSPDYLIHFKQEELDQIIDREKELLDNAKDLVEDDGRLVYIIDTLSKKESKGIIQDFLKENPEFSLEEERQFFPFDKYDSSMYFAILHKGVIDD